MFDEAITMTPDPEDVQLQSESAPAAESTNDTTTPLKDLAEPEESSTIPVASLAAPTKPIPTEVIDLTEMSSDSSESGSDEEGGEEGEYSDSEIAEINNPAISDATREQLHNAIATVSAARLRSVVARLATDVPAAERFLIQALVVVEQTTREIVPRWETCANCGEEFDLQEDHGEAECDYHTGVLQVRQERFHDWDENVHGQMDTPSNRALYPDNFMWACCKENALGAGCQTGEHVVEGQRKRQRIE